VVTSQYQRQQQCSAGRYAITPFSIFMRFFDAIIDLLMPYAAAMPPDAAACRRCRCWRATLSSPRLRFRLFTLMLPLIFVADATG